MTGDAIPLFLDLVDRGIIRVLDVLFVRKDDDRTFSGVRPRRSGPGPRGDLAVFAGATRGLLGDDDVALAAAEIEPGSARS